MTRRVKLLTFAVLLLVAGASSARAELPCLKKKHAPIAPPQHQQIYGFPGPSYRYGWFGAEYRPRKVYHYGYYGDYWQWGYQRGY